jgi:membrane protein CcdC involved in cytochrome C biogenesis
MCQKIAITQHCQLINSNLSKEQEPSANLSLKAKAQGIKMIIEVLNKNNVTNYAINSENLAGSISDVQKRVAMLTSYRDNLEQLSKKTNASLESLMKVNQEMATVQSEIETLRGEHAFMVDRVQTQTLNISISTKYLSTTEDTFITVLKDAIIGSIDDAINGLKLILVAFIYLLPWAFLGFVVYFIYRKIKLKA